MKHRTLIIASTVGVGLAVAVAIASTTILTHKDGVTHKAGVTPNASIQNVHSSNLELVRLASQTTGKANKGVDVAAAIAAMDETMTNRYGVRGGLYGDPVSSLHAHYAKAATLLASDNIIAAQIVMEEASRHPDFRRSPYGMKLREMLQIATTPPAEDGPFNEAISLLERALSAYRGEPEAIQEPVRWVLRGGMFGDAIAMQAGLLALDNMGRQDIKKRAMADAEALDAKMALMRESAQYDDEGY